MCGHADTWGAASRDGADGTWVPYRFEGAVPPRPPRRSPPLPGARLRDGVLARRRLRPLDRLALDRLAANRPRATAQAAVGALVGAEPSPEARAGAARPSGRDDHAADGRGSHAARPGGGHAPRPAAERDWHRARRTVATARRLRTRGALGAGLGRGLRGAPGAHAPHASRARAARGGRVRPAQPSRAVPGRPRGGDGVATNAVTARPAPPARRSRHPSARAAPTSPGRGGRRRSRALRGPAGADARLSEAHLADGRAAALAQLDAGGGRTLQEAAAV